MSDQFLFGSLQDSKTHYTHKMYGIALLWCGILALGGEGQAPAPSTPIKALFWWHRLWNILNGVVSMGCGRSLEELFPVLFVYAYSIFHKLQSSPALSIRHSIVFAIGTSNAVLADTVTVVIWVTSLLWTISCHMATKLKYITGSASWKVTRLHLKFPTGVY